MNQDQLLSFFRTLAKLAGAALAAHGVTVNAGVQAIIGTIIAGIAAYLSHSTHSDDPPTGGAVATVPISLTATAPAANPTIPTTVPLPAASESPSPLPKLVSALLLFLFLSLAPATIFTGCKGTPNRIAFNTVASITSGVAAAVQGYWDFKAQFPGKISPADDEKVHEAYVKYQDAMQVVADGYKMFGFAGTNSPPGFHAMESAAIAAGTDVLNLIAQFKK